MAEKGLKLSKLPKEKEFEEYVSSLFQSDGFYIEKNIIDRQDKEILELDSIVTNYNTIVPRFRFVEVKSGDWGFSDLFKIRGWQDYTKIRRSLFIAQKTKTKLDFYKSVAKKISINLIVIDDLENPQNYLNRVLKTRSLDAKDYFIWRYSYWLERNLLKLLNHKKKSVKNKDCYVTISQYYHNINNGVFLTENILDRIEKLFDNFKNNGRISARTGHDMIGEDFNQEYDSMPQKVYTETYFDCKLNDIQITSYIEHFSRLTILKNTIDYLMFKQNGDKARTDDIYTLFGDFKFSKLNFLPSKFVNKIEELEKHKYFNRYAVFWQWFLWYFGGFILLDYEKEDYELMSKKTGIPIEEIPNALSAMDVLFPIRGGWFYDLPYSNIRILQLFSVPFRGIGVNARRIHYSKDCKFENLKLTRKHTHNDLISWNNLAVEVLDKF
jgi:hypothetical protein